MCCVQDPVWPSFLLKALGYWVRGFLEGWGRGWPWGPLGLQSTPQGFGQYDANMPGYFQLLCPVASEMASQEPVSEPECKKGPPWRKAKMFRGSGKQKRLSIQSRR